MCVCTRAGVPGHGDIYNAFSRAIISPSDNELAGLESCESSALSRGQADARWELSGLNARSR